MINLIALIKRKGMDGFFPGGFLKNQVVTPTTTTHPLSHTLHLFVGAVRIGSYFTQK